MGAVGLNDGTSPASLVQQMSLQPQASDFTPEALTAKPSIPVSPGGMGNLAAEGLWLTSNVNAPLMLANLRESMTKQALPCTIQQGKASPAAQQGQLPSLASPKSAALSSTKLANGLARLPLHLYGEAAQVKSAVTAPLELASVPSPRQHATGREARHRAPVKGKTSAPLQKGSVAPGAMAWDRSRTAPGKVKAMAAAVAPAQRDRRRKP